MEDKNNNQPSTPTATAEPPKAEPASQPEAATQPQPQPQTQPQQPPQPSQNNANTFTNLPKKSGPNKGLIIGLIVLIIAIVGGAAAWFLYFSPDAKAQRASNAFMAAATEGDLDTLYELGEAEDDDAKDFLKSASEGVEGDFELDEKGKEDGKYYFLYGLTNDENKYARTIVENDGGFEVTSFVWGAEELALIPAEVAEADSPEPSESANTDPQPQQTATTLACLSHDDYKWFNYNKEPDTVTYDTTYDREQIDAFNKKGTMFFKPDSIEETSLPSIYDDWAEFASKNQDKQWTFRLIGSTYGVDPGVSQVAKDFAQQRANEVKRELMSRGVPESRISIEEPYDFGDEAQDDDLDQIYRRVEVYIDPTCDASNSSQQNGSGL